jgi:hypothetical protein
MGLKLLRGGLSFSAASALCALALVAALATLAAPGAGGQSAAAGDECDGPTAGGVRVEILSASQEQILDRRKLKAEVQNCLDGRAKVALTGKSEVGGSTRRITRRRLATLGRAPKQVGLRLNKRGRRRIARCDAQELVVRARSVLAGGPDKGTSVKARDFESLDTDAGACNPPPGSQRVYAVNPGSDATHANGTPRDLNAVATGSDPVIVALFACSNVSEAGDELDFLSQSGGAIQGSSGAGITEVKGQATGGSPQKTGPVTAHGGPIEIEINGSDGCARTVVFNDGDGDNTLDVDAGGIPTERYGGGGETVFEPQGVVFQNAGRCDPTDPAVCLFPWPNDHFTVADGSTDSGRRLNLQSDSMPRNRAGVPLNPADYNRNDGFSPGQLIVTRIPGLETAEAFANTGPVPVTDLGAYADEDAPVVVIDAATGERHPIFTELDANPANPADVTLLIRPSVNWQEGHRYVVALRDLRDAGDEPIPAQRAFQLYRDEIVTSDTAVEARRSEFEQNFDELEDAGIDRSNLYLAWDFTVASERNLSERMLSIRDDAFAALGDTNLSDLEVQGQAPSFVVTGVTDYEPCGSDGCSPGGNPLFELPEVPVFGGPDGLPVIGSIIGPSEDQLGTLLGNPPEDDRIARKVEGQVVVPCYLNLPGCVPGSQFQFSSQTDTIPDRAANNFALANFTCLIPRAALTAPAGSSRPSLYGHGLLGSAGEVEAGNVKAMADEHNFVECATDWAGFSTTDVPIVLANLTDIGQFPKLADRMQQGFLNFMYLGRLLIHDQGFSASPAFQFGGQPVIDRQRLYYDGNSQGGIMGGGLTSVAPDFERAVLGVPAMNYSTLLRRSSDFAPYAEGDFGFGDTDLGLYDNYPNELERPLLLSMVQMLWDRGEADGYAHHMTSDPLPDTPAHKVLMHVAFGDHQVTNVAADVEARTIGAATNVPSLDPGRIPGGEPLWNVPAIPSFPFEGSAIVYYDSGPPRDGDQGVVNPPTTNTPPGNPSHGRDPHGDPRSDPNARIQKSEFLKPNGRVVDVCGGEPCYAHGWTGAP